MKGDKLTAKQDRFARNIFLGMSQRAAWIDAGYSSKYAVARIDSHACVLAASGKVKERLSELQAAEDTKAVMTVQERKKRLSEIGRGRVVDFIIDGKIKVDKTIPNVGAVESVKNKTQKVNDVILSEDTELKLLNPIAAIQELNKMEHVYETGTTVVNQIQITEVVMVRPEVK